VKKFGFTVGRLQTLDQVSFFAVLGFQNFFNSRPFGNNSGNFGISNLDQFIKVAILVRPGRNRYVKCT